ncbi:hypothetical protein P872_11020 [Rhodonellum psychrophilum GCM71 = DSM 17998]|uniref:Uncharacterized protein n=1 Tax=Rhodonellum psychrophilum GCM71 = DSM 17998 TaxID=1123057 RepID=U5BYD6_9BACT|nr:hypothetical protein P872_11020 [Rhodonellum psychrophilum GCM71 = DSM 17998]
MMEMRLSRLNSAQKHAKKSIDRLILQIKFFLVNDFWNKNIPPIF